MLSIGEVHNMGLARGFRPESLYGRDTYGLETVALEAAGGNVMLQQQLNDLIANSFVLQQQQQCSDSFNNQTVGDSSACLMGATANYPELTSIGFSQSDIDRTSFLLDDLPPMVEDDDYHENHLPSYLPVSNVQPPPATFSAISPLVMVSSSLQPQQWVAENLISPRGLKREGSIDQTVSLPPRKKLDRSARTIDPKSKRPATEPAGDHIMRERQRRDDMTHKFAVLESLLPIGIKRDRSTIVDDSIEYVKNLHHRIKSLQERKVELNKSAAAATSNQQTACERGRVELRHGVSSPSQVKMEKAALAVSQNPRLSEEELKGIHDVLRSCVEKMEVHADLPHQVVIEMVCKPQPRLQSNILLCMENLNLDVMQCSINKIAHRLICVITAKPQEENVSGIVATLKHALQR